MRKLLDTSLPSGFPNEISLYDAQRSALLAMRLSIVIPVYNERATIIELLDRVAAVDLDTEVIVVDDGSTDGTRHSAIRPSGVARRRFER